MVAPGGGCAEAGHTEQHNAENSSDDIGGEAHGAGDATQAHRMVCLHRDDGAATACHGPVMLPEMADS